MHVTTAAQPTPGVQLLGVNLSGAEDGNPVTGVANVNYVYPTTSEIDYFASLGLNTIRIPVAWQRLQPTQDGPLSTTQLSQLANLVAYAATKGITVDIDLHNAVAAFGADVGTAQTPDSSFANFWSQMAQYFKNSPNVMFGLMNEPNSQTPAAWAVAAQAAVNAIRAAGATQEILVSGSDWDTASSWISSGNAASVGEITDPLNNVVFEVHQYFDIGSTGTNTAVLSPTIGPQSLAAITQWAQANGKKLFLGEFGAGGDPASLTALSNTLNYLNANATVWQGGTYWAGGPWLGNYMLSADPQNGVEAPQTAVLAAAAAKSQSIAIYSATTAVTTTQTAGATPFSGVVITGANAAQTTTATVTLRSTLNGFLSDPNAATDGSQIVNGVWKMSGSSTAVAVALDQLTFTPSAAVVAVGHPVTTTVDAVIAETGESASATSTITTGGAVPISITPATINIATTDAATAEPFAGIVITDPNPEQTETATVTLSSPGNGTLSDPHVNTDGSTILNGVWSVSGLATSVAAALDGLVFTPTPDQGAPGSAVTTTATAIIEDTAGETAAAISTITAAAVVAPIAVTPAIEAVATTDAASVEPFTGIAITDAYAGQTETASVTLSAAANGTLVDPNAATDGSTILGGVWNVSGSLASVAAALDGLVFTPTPHQVAPGGAVTTTVTADIEDTSGNTAVAQSTITAAAVAAPITLTPATQKVATTNTASAEPFTGMTITDANAGQIETATVTSSVAANGKLSDPDAATDGSTVANGVLTVSGAPASVAAALDGLVFTPSVNAGTPGVPVATTVTATVKDSAGETASAASTITATAPPIIDTIVLNMSEDHADGDAAFTVSVNGQQVGGDYQAHALHASGDAGIVSLTGEWGSGVNDVEVSFINHAYGRNLYVNSISENGVTDAGTSASFPRNGSHSFAVGGTTPVAAGAADTVTVNLSEDAWDGNALFALYIDGKAVTTPQVVSALRDANQTQGFTFVGNWGAGTHTIGVACANSSYGPKAGEERDIYVDGITLNGSSVFSGATPQHVTNGVSSLTVTTTH
jgi:endoglucanase